MKRDPTMKPATGVRKIWPLLFWHKCQCCEMEVRREMMYQFHVDDKVNRYPGSSGTNIIALYTHICGQCLTSDDPGLLSGLLKYLRAKHLAIPPRPKAPPMPPCKPCNKPPREL